MAATTHRFMFYTTSTTEQNKKQKQKQMCFDIKHKSKG